MKKFKELSKEERSEIVEYIIEHEEIDIFYEDTKIWRRIPVIGLTISIISSYQIPKTKPYINWDHVHPDFIAMVTDFEGTYLYKNKPEINGNVWESAGWCIGTNGFSSFKKGTCDWKDSLVMRPE